MDLLQTVKKEGSRGGRADFKWEDVKADQHRENYLGHSLMAPVGRWQKGRDLNWYAKSTDANGVQQTEAEARKEEIRRVKEAEADALARALGYEVPPRPVEGSANMAPLGDKAAERMIKQSMAEDVEGEDAVKGIGFGTFEGARGKVEDDEEIMEGANTGRGGLDKENGQRIRRNMDKEDKSREERRRSRSGDGERRKHRHRLRDEREPRARRRSRSRSKSRDRTRRSRSREQRPNEGGRGERYLREDNGYSRRHERGQRRRSRSRSRSPNRHSRTNRKD